MEDFIELIISFFLASVFYALAIGLTVIGIGLISGTSDPIFLTIGIVCLLTGLFLLFLKIRWDIRDLKK
jgi:hypothetical protein